MAKIRQIHMRRASAAAVWVKEPRPGEAILATRMQRTKHGKLVQLFKVNRPRRACTVLGG